MAKDINKTAFDDATKDKLKIFGECFEEWLPVFINDNYTKEIYIFDFFAGSGKDLVGENGSPLILLEKAKGDKQHYCSKAKKVKKNIYFIFNEGVTNKSHELKKNVEDYLEKCKMENDCEKCIYKHQVAGMDFEKIFNNVTLKRIFNNKEIGKFVLLDQYGFKHINADVFKKLISFPKTDFIFFISSSYVKRFKESKNTKAYIDTSKINFDETEPKEVHRVITQYYKSLIPQDKKYYLHHFSIKKGSNYYGLIFGTNHTYGMEKFLKVCWNYDPLSGEANYNIDNNWESNTLFGAIGQNVKKDRVKNEIKNAILEGDIVDNSIGLSFTLEKGCEPELFVKTVDEMLKDKQIQIIGKFNRQSTKIHKIKNKYKIKVN